MCFPILRAKRGKNMTETFWSETILIVHVRNVKLDIDLVTGC